jgi:hypothetical protein
MHNPLQRWNKRQFELANGADADLVGGNRSRSKLAFWFMGGGTLLLSLDALFSVPIWFQRLVFFCSVLTIVVGFLLFRWASAEDAFLSRPEPKGPPSILNH